MLIMVLSTMFVGCIPDDSSVLYLKNPIIRTIITIKPAGLMVNAPPCWLNHPKSPWLLKNHHVCSLNPMKSPFFVVKYNEPPMNIR